MDKSRWPDDLLDVARVLLLVQGGVLLATTIEAVVWGMAFAGAAGLPLLLSGAAALAILVARARLRPDRRRTRRVIYGVETFTLASFALDLALALALTGTPPPPVAILTRFVLPLSVIYLLRQSARASAGPVSLNTAAAEGTL